MATKIKTRFFCQECGYETAKWLGQCPGCKAWNSLVEEPVSVTAGGKEKKQVLSGVQSAPAVLNEISMEEERRTETGMGELDRVLGGGIVTGSLTLVGGDPGIGKSTLLLQMCRNLSLKSSTFCMYQARNPYARSKCVRCGSAIFRTRWSCSVRRT